MKQRLLWTLGAPLCFVVATSHAEVPFKPSGTIGVTQTFYGNAGSYKTSTAHPSLSFSYNFAPKWNLTLQWDRTWNLYNYTGADNQQNNAYSKPAATLTYNHGNLSGSKVNWTSALTVENQNSFQGSNQSYVFGQTSFDFSQYLPKGEYIQATQFALSPQYVYGWSTGGPAGHMNTAALALLTNWNLPAGFSFTLNAYGFRSWYNGSFMVGNPNTNANYKTANYFMAFAWLQYSKNLHKFNDKTSLDFNFTGGLDPYINSNRNASWDPFLVGNSMYEWLSPTLMQGTYDSTYTLFALPQLKLTFQSSDKLSLNFFVQMKYSNQVWGANKKGWAFQPQAGLGLNFAF